MDGNKMDYEFIKSNASDLDLEKYRVCFQNNGTNKSLSNIRWLHIENPTEKNMIYFSLFNSELAAIYTAIPVFIKIASSELLALQSIDTITEVQHRGKKLFPRLANLLYQDAASNSFEFVYGFPNQNSAPGFFNKLGWVSFGEAPFLMKPMRLSYFIKRLLKIKSSSDANEAYSFPESKKINSTTEIRKIDSFDYSYDEIWQKASSDITVAVQRNARYLNWRYVNKPEENYHKYGIYVDGKLEGIVVFAVKVKHGGRIGYIMELIYNPTNDSLGSNLLKFANKALRTAKTDVVLAWCFNHSFNFTNYLKTGYFRMPLKFRPQRLFLGVKSFNPSVKQIVEDPKNWYISYSDSDTV